MKPLAILVLAAALCALVAPAQAETAHWFGYSGGVSYPRGDIKDWVTHAYQMGATYTYMMNPVFGVGGEVSYSRWTNTKLMNDEVAATFGPEFEFKQSDWSYTMHGVAALPVTGVVQPYAKAGIGYFSPKAALDDGANLATGSQNYFGHTFGAGLSWAVRPTVRFNAEGSFRQYHDSHADVLARYWSATAQVLFRMNWSTKI